MEKLHFTLGDDAGLLLSQIAWERIFMDLSPAKAISIFVDSLQGLPYSLALELLHGDKLFCGLEKKFCSGTRFGFTEKPMLAKLFDAL